MVVLSAEFCDQAYRYNHSWDFYLHHQYVNWWDNYQVSSRIYVPVRLPSYYWDCLMRVTDIRGSAHISAHSVVFFLYYWARLVLYFSTRKECCSHDYHVVSATQEHNDNSSLYLRSLSHTHSFIHTCSLFFCISPGLLRAQDFWPASISWLWIRDSHLQSGLKHTDRLSHFWPNVNLNPKNEMWKTLKRITDECMGNPVVCDILTAILLFAFVPILTKAINPFSWIKKLKTKKNYKKRKSEAQN